MADANKKSIQFLRTPSGVKLIGGKYSVHLLYAEIAALNQFVASGARASSPKIEKMWERASLRSAPLRELEAELDRRAALRDARIERGDDPDDE